MLEQHKYLNVNPGDLVLLRTPGTAIKDKIKKYTGPYRILKRYSPAVYKIEDLEKRRWQVVNQVRLKRYFPPNKIDDSNLAPPREFPKPKKKKGPDIVHDPVNPAVAEDDEIFPPSTPYRARLRGYQPADDAAQSSGSTPPSTPPWNVRLARRAAIAARSLGKLVGRK